MSIFRELRRRHVFKVAAAYIVLAWLILQVTDVFMGNLGLPEWTFKLILLLLVVGLPVVIMFAWAYDLTPGGIVRTDEQDARTVDEEAVAAPLASETERPRPIKASVAVLPFVNMSDDKANEYFSDGLAEELLNVLSKISALKVAARTSSFHFKGQTGNIAEIADCLGVASVLEGSVRQSAEQVRVTAQLINAADGYHLWSETYDRKLDDIFAVQDEIASSVATALKVKLLGDEDSHFTIGGTTNTDAFKQYLQGVHFRNHGSDKEALVKATEAFEHAITLDPDYAQAHAGLASAWEQLITNNFMPLDLVSKKIEAPANRAIELEPNLADSYVVLNRMLLHYRLDEAGAQAVIEKAISLNPGNVDVQIEYARINSYFCKHDEAVAAARAALDLDPISMFAYHFLGHVLYFARRYNEAIRVFRQVLVLEPSYPRPHYGIAMSLFLQDQSEPALDELQLEPLDWMRFSGLAIVLGRLGRNAEAKENLEKLIEGYAENGLYQQAQTHAQWGDSDSALAALNQSREIGDPGTSQLLVDPLLDPIRDDPRFEALLAKTGYRNT